MQYTSFYNIKILTSRRGENDEDIAFLNEKNPALQDVVRRLPSILTDFKIKSVDLVINQTHVKVISNTLKILNFITELNYKHLSEYSVY